MSDPDWDPFNPFANKEKKDQKKPDDPFTLIAIKFLLGVGVGFSLVCMGFVFLFIALLATTTERYETPSSLWALLGVASEVIGIFMMYYTLRGSPKPGDYPTY